MSLLTIIEIMKKQKKYFKSPYIKGNEEYLHNEFSKKVPLDGLLEGDKNLSSTATSRRDFLKFLGFSTAAAVLSSCEAPVRKSIPYLNKPEEIITNESIYAIFLYLRKSIDIFLNKPLVRYVEKLNCDPLLISQLTNNLEINIAVKRDVIIPIKSVVAKPSIGPVPNTLSIKAVNPVVIFASKIEEYAL